MGGLHGDWNWFTTVGRPHNVFQLAGGFATARADLAVGQSYGGFGNQIVENEEVGWGEDRLPGTDGTSRRWCGR